MKPPLENDRRIVARLSGFRRGYTSPLEQRFQREYYARVAPAIRLAAVLITALMSVMLVISGGARAPYDLAVMIPQIVFWLCVLALTFSRRVACTWQSLIVCAGLLTAGLVL